LGQNLPFESQVLPPFQSTEFKNHMRKHFKNFQDLHYQ